jgi:hypothetical protein
MARAGVEDDILKYKYGQNIRVTVFKDRIYCQVLDTNNTNTSSNVTINSTSTSSNATTSSNVARNNISSSSNATTSNTNSLLSATGKIKRSYSTYTTRRCYTPNNFVVCSKRLGFFFFFFNAIQILQSKLLYKYK